jgi:flagellar protein FliS
MRNISHAYLETQVMTASPERLHLMVVEAAIRSGRQAEAALAENNIETAFLALSQCRSCVCEILAGINVEPNPEVGESLKGLFAFVQKNLLFADVRRDPQLVRDALTILESHRRTWLELLDRLQQERAALRGPHGAEIQETSWTT